MRVITFGEILLRLSPIGDKRLTQSDSLNLFFGGAEANVAAELAAFGLDAAFVSQVPDNTIGQMAISSLRKVGVDTSFVDKRGERLGIYYYERGAVGRCGNVIYDRTHSSFCDIDEGDFDFSRILENANLLHISGIAMAINPNLTNICVNACKIAKAKGVKVSFDFNYRAKLWSIEVAKKAFEQILPYVDICFLSKFDVYDILGIGEKNDADELAFANFRNKYKNILQIGSRYKLSDNRYIGMLFSDKFYYSKEFTYSNIEAIGGGDAFAGGFIYAYLNDYSYQKQIDFASAASRLKYSVAGDINLTTKAEVNATLINSSNPLTR